MPFSLHCDIWRSAEQPLYKGSAEYRSSFHTHLVPAHRTLATNSERVLSALWGKLAAEILMQQWETALDDIQKLRDIIDANTFAPILQQLQQRVWLMHWSLFVFFEHENGRNAIIDLFFQDR
jgi:translation initiation factor 3 subunit E